MRKIFFILFLLFSSVVYAQQSTTTPSYTNAKAQTATGWTKTGTNVALTTSTDNVGIGTLLPRQKLEVDGIIYSQTGGFRFPDNTTQTTAATNTPPGGNSKAIQFNNAGAFGGVDTFIYDIASGNVGIGTESPVVKLEIQDGVAAVKVKSTTGTNHATLYFSNTGGSFYLGRNGSSGTGLVGTGGLAYAGILNAQGTYPLQFATNNSVAMTILNGGNVGIGSSLPTNLLQVSGSVAIGTTMNGLTAPTNGIIIGGNVGIGSAIPTAKLTVTGNGTTTGVLADFKNSANATKVTILDGGNVGIGSVTPTAALDVVGSVKATSLFEGANQVGMTLVATASPNAASSFTFSGLSNTNSYRLVFVGLQNTSDGYWKINFNSDTGANYNYSLWMGNSNATLAISTGAGGTTFYVAGRTVKATGVGSVYIDLTPSGNNVYAAGMIHFLGKDDGYSTNTVGNTYLGSSSLSTLVFATSAGTFTGTAKLYRMN